MIHHKDRTYCSVRCFNLNCDRNKFHAEAETAELEYHDKFTLPIAVSDFSQSPYCIGYQPTPKD